MVPGVRLAFTIWSEFSLDREWHAERELNTSEKREIVRGAARQINSVRTVTYNELFTKLRVTTTL